MAPTRCRLVLLGNDAGALQSLRDRARTWGGTQFEIDVQAPQDFAADEFPGAAFVALDAAAVAACSKQHSVSVDLSTVAPEARPQLLIQQMRRMLPAGEPGQFSAERDIRIESRVPLHQGFVKLERIDFRHRLHTGGWSPLLGRETMHRCPAVGVLPYDPQRDEVLLIEQIRIAALEDRNGPWLLELIAGLVEPGEVPEEVCLRESLEEAGVTIRGPRLIADYLPSTGISDEQMLVYVARFDAGAAGGIHGLIEEGEDIRVVTMSTAEALELLAAGRISNAATIIALQWLMLNIGQLRKEWSAG